MKTVISNDERFLRPPLGAQFLAPDGNVLEVAATWEQGVVFYGERCCTAAELAEKYFRIDAGAQQSCVA